MRTSFLLAIFASCLGLAAAAVIPVDVPYGGDRAVDSEGTIFYMVNITSGDDDDRTKRLRWQYRGSRHPNRQHG